MQDQFDFTCAICAKLITVHIENKITSQDAVEQIIDFLVNAGWLRVGHKWYCSKCKAIEKPNEHRHRTSRLAR